MSSIETQGVLYSASFDIPYAIGSVAIPLAYASPAAAAAVSADSTHDLSRSKSTAAVGTSSVYSNTHDRSSSRTSSLSPSPPLSTAPTVTAAAARRRGVTSGNISSVRRCTHHRFCYLRDGGDLAQDAFYRWVQHRQAQLKEGEEPQQMAKRKEKEDGATTASATGTSTTTPAPPSSSTSLTHTPSLFYGSLACVVFVLPNSFPQPRRVVRQPPFVIEDDTWAEHTVEVQLHFLPHLCIPPVTVVHQVLLEQRTMPVLPPVSAAQDARKTEDDSSSGLNVSLSVPLVEVREVLVPQLLASTYGKAKVPPVATNVLVPITDVSLRGTQADADISGHAASLSPDSFPEPSLAGQIVVVAEKADTLRLYHPSLPVLRHLHHMRAVAALPVLAELRSVFKHLYPLLRSSASTSFPAPHAGDAEDVNDASLDTPFLYPWSLPYEDVVRTYVTQRATTSVAVLRAVLANLKRERVTLEDACVRSMRQISELATEKIPARLREAHDRCLKLYRKE